MDERSDASRPEPRGYFLPEEEGTGLLPWATVEARLVTARNYWLATASASGTPHVMPVWGVWIDGALLFSTGATTRKARNIETNPNVAIHLESGAELVVVEGSARAVADEPLSVQRFLDAYNPKYSWDFTADAFEDGGLYAVTPHKAFAWLGDEGEAFSGTATRWIFGA